MDKTRQAADEINHNWMELSLLSPSLRKKRIEAMLRRIFETIELTSIPNVSSELQDRISQSMSSARSEGQSEKGTRGRKKS
jgi:hypothetical protein